MAVAKVWLTNMADEVSLRSDPNAHPHKNRPTLEQHRVTF